MDPLVRIQTSPHLINSYAQKIHGVCEIKPQNTTKEIVREIKWITIDFQCSNCQRITIQTVVSIEVLVRSVTEYMHLPQYQYCMTT